MRVCTYEQESDVLQHVGVVQPVGAALPLAQHANAGLPLLQRQVHVVPAESTEVRSLAHVFILKCEN